MAESALDQLRDAEAKLAASIDRAGNPKPGYGQRVEAIKLRIAALRQELGLGSGEP